MVKSRDQGGAPAPARVQDSWTVSLRESRKEGPRARGWLAFRFPNGSKLQTRKGHATQGDDCRTRGETLHFPHTMPQRASNRKIFRAINFSSINTHTHTHTHTLTRNNLLSQPMMPVGCRGFSLIEADGKDEKGEDKFKITDLSAIQDEIHKEADNWDWDKNCYKPTN